MCLFLSMVVWQPFSKLALYHCACLRNARRISYSATNYGLSTSAEQTFNISNDFAIPLLPSFLPYLHHQMCVWGGRRREGECRVRLKMCVRWFFDRKVQCQPTTACCCHVFVPQYGRLAAVSRTGVISLRVSPKCTPHIIRIVLFVVYLHQRNKQHSTSQRLWIPLLLSFLPYLHRQMCVCVGGDGG